MRTIKTRLTLFVALVLGLVGQAVWAQDTGTLAMGYTITVKEGMSDGFEEAAKQHMAWRQANGDPWQWNAYTIVVGENLGTYGFRSGNHTWADLDAYAAWEAESGANAHFEATVGPYVESASNALSELDTALSHMPDGEIDFNLAAVTTFQLKPGQQFVFENAIETLKGALDKENYPMHFIIDWPGLGSDGPSVSFVRLHKDWAAFAPPSEEIGDYLQRTLGQDEAGQLFQQFMSTIHTEKSFVALLRRDLSSAPAMQGTQ